MVLRFSLDFLVQPPEEGFHKFVPFYGDDLPFRRVHLVLGLGKLQDVFAIGGVFPTVFRLGAEVGIGVVEDSVVFAREEERPADSYRADPVELVGVEEDLGLDRLGRIVAPEPV